MFSNNCFIIIIVIIDYIVAFPIGGDNKLNRGSSVFYISNGQPHI